MTSKICAINGMTAFKYQPAELIQCEFFLLDALKCELIVYHPYAPLEQYLENAEMIEFRVCLRAYFMSIYIGVLFVSFSFIMLFFSFFFLLL
jgi:hypothetical protein